MAQAPHILIIGGGAGGLELAIRLARATRRGGRARVTLVDSSPAHVWKPRLHEIAVGLLVAAEEQANYAEQAAAHGFAFVLGATDTIDVTARTARVGAVREPDGPRELLPQRTSPFDIAVLAIGSTVDDFGTPGVHEHCHVLDTPEGAERLHRAILAQAARVAAGEQERLRIAIVGAGTTGVELAAELRSATGRLAQYRSLMDPGQIDITLLDMADRPLPGVATDTSDYARRLLDRQRVAMRFGTKVTAVELGILHLAEGGTVAADIIVWVSGVRGRALEVAPKPKLEKGGRMRVDPMLRLLGEDGHVLDGLYAIGDCAACFEAGSDKPVGATAQAAHQQARLLARSLVRQLDGRPPLPFTFYYRGTLVSLGAGKAVGDVPTGGWSFRIAGLTAKLAYQWLYITHLAELFGWTRTGASALASLLRRSARPSIKLHW
ncbi:NAD(P)/FAD-dependent oxidoreductase [Sphingomonas bacterium]|uniref:NAD(P)/FAD-dependent oxidoreductase n=1 Tax=Sphingomonas bacterium TaxID=1895847 RepID=UPI001576BBEB|nr:FAD-dependent oxidoreductase [Sphingomonas bacterium]